MAKNVSIFRHKVFFLYLCGEKSLTMRQNIIGRIEEKKLLDAIYHSARSEFVAVCGRRRVGKTFLIKEFFEKELVFHTSGVANSSKKEQISVFYRELQSRSMHALPSADNWMDIFFLLRKYLEGLGSQKKVILLDELPWMDTAKSGFIPALEYFWNVWASSRRDIVLIVCGSATSWMMDKLINSHGGLHNRLTHQIFLHPFTLAECEEFFISRNFHLSRYEIAEYYMVMGGTPYYLEALRPDISLSQNIDNLFFRANGALRNEFMNLYAALFKNSADYIEVVRALSGHREGLSRGELVRFTTLSSGGNLTIILNNLESCGFIRHYQTWMGKRSDHVLYQLVDFFTLFHFRFLEHQSSEHQWSSIQGKPQFYTWAGLTFELLALQHTPQIKEALGISGIQTQEYAWRGSDGSGSSQIDLLIERADQTVNICEIKYSLMEYEITKDYEAILRHKLATFMEATRMRKSAVLTMITTYGVRQGKYTGIVQREVTLDDLFRPVRLTVL